MLSRNWRSFIYLIVLYSTIVKTLQEDPLRCARCQAILKPEDCSTYTECRPGHLCSTRGYITTQGHALYDLGCLPTKICDDLGVIKREKGAVYYAECCKEMNCNRDLFRPKQGIECGKCAFVSDPRECHDINTCPKDQACWFQFYINDQIKTTYIMDCIKKEMCHSLQAGRRDAIGTHIHSECCEEDYCNIINSITYHKAVQASGFFGKVTTFAPHSEPPMTFPTRGPGPIMCSKCQGTFQAKDCEYYDVCASDEMCYTRGYITNEGHHLFSMGCMQSKRCLNKEQFLDKRSAAVAVYFEECCDEYNLCNKALFSHPTKMFCGDCDHAGDPRECHKVQTCAFDERCLFEYSVNDLFERKYFLGCASNFECEKVKRSAREAKFTNIHSECCQGDFCNVVNAINYHRNLFSNSTTTTTNRVQTTIETSKYITNLPTTARPTTPTTTVKPTTKTTFTPVTSTTTKTTTTTKLPTTTTEITTTTKPTTTTTTTTPSTTTVEHTIYISKTITTTVKPTTTEVPTTTKPTTSTLATTTTPSTTTVGHSIFISTTTTRVPTTKAPTTKPHGHSVMCYQCEGAFCYIPGSPQACPSNKHYCLNHVDVLGPGNIVTTKRCANRQECETKWWEGSSDRIECTSLTDNMYSGNVYSCDFCCTSDGCNNPLVPDRKTLFRGHS